MIYIDAWENVIVQVKSTINKEDDKKFKKPEHSLLYCFNILNHLMLKVRKSQGEKINNHFVLMVESMG